MDTNIDLVTFLHSIFSLIQKLVVSSNQIDIMQTSKTYFLLALIVCIGAVWSCSHKRSDTMTQNAHVTEAVSIEKATVKAADMEIKSVAQQTGFNPKEFFEKFCSGCHGQKMKTFVDRKWEYGSTQEDIERSIAKGMVNEGMPAYEQTLKPEEITILAQYILQGIADRKSYDIVEDSTPKHYVSDYYNLRVDTIVDGLEIPWGIKVLADGTIFFTERKGTFNIKRPGAEAVAIQGVPDSKAHGQGGMMDVALHPQYEDNGWIYLSYTKSNGLKYTTAVVRGKIKGNKFVDQEDIFEALPYVSTKYHFGSRIVFDQEGYMYVTVGDRGKRDDHPQFLSNACGKVHRLFDDGRVPQDNPYYNDAEAIKSIWSYGHRNPQGMVYDAQNDNIWVHEHGPRGGDELNLVEKAVNYGWPIVSYGINYNGTTFTDKSEMEGMRHPVNVWIPSIAPSGMAVVDAHYPHWKGDILSGSLRFNYISRVRVNGDQLVEEERILQDIGRVRAIEMGADGHLYVGVEDKGRILRVVITADNALDQR